MAVSGAISAAQRLARSHQTTTEEVVKIIIYLCCPKTGEITPDHYRGGRQDNHSSTTPSTSMQAQRASGGARNKPDSMSPHPLGAHNSKALHLLPPRLLCRLLNEPVRIEEVRRSEPPHHVAAHANAVQLEFQGLCLCCPLCLPSPAFARCQGLHLSTLVSAVLGHSGSRPWR